MSITNINNKHDITHEDAGNSKKRKTEGNDTGENGYWNYKKQVQGSAFENFPRVMLQKVLSYCPFKTAQVCKVFHENIAALKAIQYRKLKDDVNCPQDLRNKFVQTEESLKLIDGSKVVHAFFQGLDRPKSSMLIHEMNFSNLHNEMISAWQADQHNLLQLWTKIPGEYRRSFDLEKYKSVEEIREWIADKENQKKLGGICYLQLNNCNLTNLPKEIIYFYGLMTLTLEDNHLQTLSSNIGSLKKLTWLSLSKNKLTSLPSEIRNLVELSDLYLNHNKLTNLTPEIGNLKVLGCLALVNNLLTSIPPEMGSLKRLYFLSLMNNPLESLPLEMECLTNLKSLHLENTKLTSLPEGLSKIKGLTITRD